MIKQRVLGLCLIVVSVLVLLIASTGVTEQDRDATAVLFTLPLGIYALTTKRSIVDAGEPDGYSVREHREKGAA